MEAAALAPERAAADGDDGVNGAVIVVVARSWLGTRFHHQGRLKGVGVDCAGLVIGVAHELGLSDYDWRDYPPQPDGEQLQAACDAQMTSIATQAIAPGDVLLMRFMPHSPHPQHLAIVGDHPAGGLSIIHAWAPARKVVEVRFDDDWRRKIVAAYRLPAPHRDSH